MPVQALLFQRLSGAAGTETLEIINAEAGAITLGQVVYADSIDETTGLTKVKLAKADATATMPALGMLASASVAAGARGFIRINGDITPIDTSWLGVNETIYVSDTVAGAVQSSAPAIPSIVQAVGFAVDSDAAGTFRLEGDGLAAAVADTAVEAPARGGVPRAGEDGKIEQRWIEPGIADPVTLSGQTAAITTTTLLASPEPGVYRVTVIAVCTTDSGGGAPKLTVTIGWTSVLGATSEPIIVDLPLTATGRDDGELNIELVSGDITYATSISTPFGSPQYKLLIRVGVL